MKSIILRFRRWLIKMLGGHTDWYAADYRFDVNQTQIKPEIIRIEMGVVPWKPLSDQEMTEYVKTDICHAIARELIEHNLVMLEYQDNSQKHDRLYRGTVAVFKAEDTAMLLPKESIWTTL
jgi:hypothetical protein